MAMESQGLPEGKAEWIDCQKCKVRELANTFSHP